MRATYAEVNVSAFAHNIRQMKQLAAPAQLMAVIKADAYGHGAIRLASAALQNGASFLATATCEEASELRESGIKAPILALGALTPDEMEHCVNQGVSVGVYLPSQVIQLQKAANLLGKQAKAHLKIDSGFHRLGTTAEALPSLLSALHDAPDVVVEGMFTHFASADMVDDSFVKEQAARFDKALALVHQAGYHPLVHMANSAATIRHKEMHRDMVRAGIVLYGYQPSDEMPVTADLRPVLSWKTQILDMHTLLPGETVGYGRTFKAETPCVIATLPVGYADGYRRELSNRAQVLVKGKRVQQVGRICMDHMMIDVSNCAGIEQGEEVVLLGQQGREAIWADEMARWLRTISYEVLTGISGRVPRVYVHG